MRESSEEPAPKKRGRKSAKRKAEDDIQEETPASKRKKGRQPKLNDSLSSTERSALQKALKEMLESLKNLEVPDSDPEPASEDESDDGPPTRLIVGPFLELPPKKLYPDYYNFIPEPIALDIIEKKINNSSYVSLKDFGTDIALLAKNAKTYNEDGSMIYNDANVIEVSIPLLCYRQKTNVSLAKLYRRDQETSPDELNVSGTRRSSSTGRAVYKRWVSNSYSSCVSRSLGRYQIEVELWRSKYQWHQRHY